MRRLLSPFVALLVVVGMASPALATPLPPIERLPMPPPPAVTAQSWILFDDTDALVLASYDADAERPMASTTKIMTGLIAYENLQPGQTTVVSERADAVGEAEIGLVAGETMPVAPLIAALLIRSGNDAAIAVAQAIGGSVDAFVAMMNQRAEELGLAHTHFVNPHGLDTDGHYTSAADLLTLARVAMANPDFAAAVGTRRMRLPNAPDGTERVAETTNHLLYDYPGAIGVKTGYTFKAGLVLVAAAERDGRRLYAVVMGSEGEGAHFADASALLDYGFDTLRIVPAVTQGVVYRETSQEELVALSAQAAFEALLHVAAVARTVSTTEPITVQSPDVVALSAQRLPGLTDAFRWFLGEGR